MRNHRMSLGSIWIVLGTTSFDAYPILGKAAVVFGLLLIFHTLFFKFYRGTKE